MQSVDKYENTRARASQKTPSNEGPVFKPGEYPIIFKCVAESEDVVVDLPVVTNFSTVTESAYEIYEAINFSDSLTRYHAQINITDAIGRVAYGKRFVGAAVLATLQQIVSAEREASLSIGPTSRILRPTLPHLRSVRVVSAQYGHAVDREIGVKLTLTGFEQQVKRGVHIAWRVTTDVTDLRERVAAMSVCPAERDDVSFRRILLSYLQRYIRARYPNILVGDDTTIFFRAQPPAQGAAVTPVPPSWVNAIPEAERPVIESFWGLLPNDATAWAAWFNALGDVWFTHSGFPRPPNDVWTVEDFAIGQSWQTHFQELSDYWTRISTPLEKFFQVYGVKSTAKAGSRLQTAQRSIRDDSSLILDTYTSVLPEEASIFALFPASAWLYETRPRDKRLVQLVDVSSKRTQWVRQDLINDVV